MIIAELLLAFGTFLSIVLSTSGPGLAPYYAAIEHFLMKPLIIAGYIVAFRQATHPSRVILKQTGTAFLLVCQFLVAATLRYVLQEFLSPSDFAGHARLYYLSFLLLYYPSFLLMILGMRRSVTCALAFQETTHFEIVDCQLAE